MDSLDRLIEKVEKAPEMGKAVVTDGDGNLISKTWVVEFDKKELLGQLGEVADEAEDMIHLPTDRDDIAVRVDDHVHLKHNGKDRRGTSLMYTGGGDWIVGCDAGGCFMLPESKDNVTHVTVDTILGEFYKEATEAQYTTDGLLRVIRKYADRLQMREETSDD